MNISIANILNRLFKFISIFIIAILTNTTIFAQNKELVLAVAHKDGYVGIIDTTGKWYIPNIYDFIGNLSEGFAPAVAANYGAEGFIHLESKTFIPLQLWNEGEKIEGYDNLSVYDYTFLYKTIIDTDTVFRSTKFTDGCVDWDTLYKPNYTFINGIAPVWTGKQVLNSKYKNGKWGYINKEGKWIFKPEFDLGRLPTNGYLLLVQGDSEVYYNINKDTLINLPYKSCGLFSEGLSCVGVGNQLVWYDFNYTLIKKGKWGYIDTCYKKVIPLKFDLAFPFSDGLALVCKNGKYGYINKKGKVEIPYQFNKGKNFTDGRAFVSSNETWGVIDTKGKWVVKPQYIEFSQFSEGLAAVKINGKWGYINRNGELVIPNLFDWAGSFQNAFEKNCTNCLNKSSIMVVEHNEWILPFDW